MADVFVEENKPIWMQAEEINVSRKLMFILLVYTTHFG